MSKHTWELTPALKQHLEEWTTGDVPWSNASRLIISSAEEGTLTLKGENAAKVLSSSTNVRLAFEALESPDDAMVEYANIEVDDDIAMTLEDLFSYVEEVE